MVSLRTSDISMPGLPSIFAVIRLFLFHLTSLFCLLRWADRTVAELKLSTPVSVTPTVTCSECINILKEHVIHGSFFYVAMLTIVDDVDCLIVWIAGLRSAACCQL